MDFSPCLTYFSLLYHFPWSKVPVNEYIHSCNLYITIAYRGAVFQRLNSLVCVALLRGNSPPDTFPPSLSQRNYLGEWVIHIPVAVNYAHFMSYLTSRCDGFWGPSLLEKQQLRSVRCVSARSIENKYRINRKKWQQMRAGMCENASAYLRVFRRIPPGIPRLFGHSAPAPATRTRECGTEITCG